MTDEQIKGLAQSCAEACLERYASVHDSEMAEAYSDVMETAIRTILETHCIVEKEVVLSDYEFNVGCVAHFSVSADDECKKLAEWHKGKCDELELLFGKEFLLSNIELFNG